MKDKCEFVAPFHSAEVSTHPDLGFLTLCLIRWQTEADGKVTRAPGLLHKLRPEQVTELIGHLKSALEQYNTPSGIRTSSSH